MKLGKLCTTSAAAWLSTLWLVAAGCASSDPATPPDDTSNPEVLDKDTAADQAEGGKSDFSGPCNLTGWARDKYCDWFCSGDPVCDESPIGPEPEGKPTRYPIVLVHGFNTTSAKFDVVAAALEQDGHTVVAVKLPRYTGAEQGAKELEAQVDEVLASTRAEKVNLIAHSMGGLFSRYLISTLGRGKQVASLSTMSTPHQGSRVADFVLEWMGGKSDATVGAVLSFFGVSSKDEPGFREAMESLCEGNAFTFNRANPDDAGVFYQSWAGVANLKGTLNEEKEQAQLSACEELLGHPGTVDKIAMSMAGTSGILDGVNDGVVEVANARWGEFHGCVPADHLDEVGAAQEAVPNTGYLSVRFFRQVAFDLAARGY